MSFDEQCRQAVMAKLGDGWRLEQLPETANKHPLFLLTSPDGLQLEWEFGWMGRNSFRYYQSPRRANHSWGAGDSSKISARHVVNGLWEHSLSPEARQRRTDALAADDAAHARLCLLQRRVEDCLGWSHQEVHSHACGVNLDDFRRPNGEQLACVGEHAAIDPEGGLYLELCLDVENGLDLLAWLRERGLTERPTNG